MGVTINGVYLDELVNEFSEDVAILGGPTATKGYICNWTDRYRAAVGFLGLANTTRIGGSITLQTPLPYPEIPTVYAHSVRIKGAGPPFQGSNNIAFPKAIIYVSYRTMPWSFTPGDSSFNQIDPATPMVFAEQTLSSSCEWITIPGSGCTWANADGTDSGTAIQQDMGVRMGLVEMEITIKNLPYMPTPTALGSAGLINKTLYLGVSPGKLIFNGITTHQTASTDGTYVQEGSFRFTARTVRWDYAYRPASKNFRQVLIKNGTEPIIQSIEFTGILPDDYIY